MALPCYMAMTSAEFASADKIPTHPAWMACHFSVYGKGLSNLPQNFPQNSMIILNDSVPPCSHQPDVILQELDTLIQRLKPSYFLLDFQRQDHEETFFLTECLCQALPCPVGVSHLYAENLNCPVFLPPPPLLKPLREYLAPWKGREIWLEISPDAALVTLSEEGVQILWDTEVSLENPVFANENLACKYQTELLENTARFHIERDLALYKQEAENCGVSLLTGLYQLLN